MRLQKLIILGLLIYTSLAHADSEIELVCFLKGKDNGQTMAFSFPADSKTVESEDGVKKVYQISDYHLKRTDTYDDIPGVIIDWSVSRLTGHLQQKVSIQKVKQHGGIYGDCHPYKDTEQKF